PFSDTSAAIATSFSRIDPADPQCSVTVLATKKSNDGMLMLIARVQVAPEINRLYQLDLVTPGINPLEASSRKVSRDTLKRRMKARRRPETWQRFTIRVGLASRGNCASPA